QWGGIEGRVMLVDLPAVFLFNQQRHGQTRNLKMLRQVLQLLYQYFGQARQAAQAQLVADLCRERLAVFAAARLPAFVQQVADVQQLQQPGIGQRLHPAAQVQGLSAEAVEVQVQTLSLPVGRRACDDEAAVRHEEIV